MANDYEHHYEHSAEHARMEAKLDNLVAEVRELKEVAHDRINRTNSKVEAIEKEVHTMQGGVKALWGVAIILSALCSGIFIKVFFG